MSDRGAGATEAVVPFAPKPNAKPEAGDPLDRAAQAILGLLHRAAADAEANYQQALEMTRQRSAQLRAAEDRIRELEAHARHHQERAERAERWLYQISVEIEQKFFGRTEARPSQPPPPEASSVSFTRCNQASKIKPSTHQNCAEEFYWCTKGCPGPIR